ncbi:Hydrophobe/amphiphile efflux-1 family transporter [Pseudomonas cannabina pv. alisalensis]|uniref:Efflux pump membrane transporter n=1 Tax=Pseudomonas cannabina TaxID=86840 RepID=A0A3M3PZM3_PSECA|nr:multidrug efflux RND transporter permease subunit [Pseudomonas cannabina]KPW16375.1 Hydrophobe/amphiphile efflux-1 family transporter [Pseudomonas cannabina pv. alisalensis]RMN77441.1 Hydrophobe/amphiphile efflux-1 [Pseudomonas cannabina]RMN86264.1 Hydrophobe/amphiphile efflux-1 [Pseudomonas cannabina pv. alisalensis]RMN87322.1 Hydrophobe/amphiphile efflux-1 [Pseudomonas cannabina]
MSFSRFFIDRPVFAGALSTLILLAGIVSLFRLPVSEYPDVVPPLIVVNAQYPGANPAVVAQTVAAPLEEQINGVEDMLYMQSQANSDGNLTLSVTFKVGTDPDKAQQLVQNRVSQALPRLPEDVRRLGVVTMKSSSTQTLAVHLVSPDDQYNATYLRNYGILNIKNQLERIPGVGEVRIWGGGDYAMRIWLDPEKVAQRGLSASDVVAAIREQNVQVAAGVIGGQPMRTSVAQQLSVNTQGRLKSEQEFGDIILKSSDAGAVTFLRDVARVELAASDYGLRSLVDGKPAVGFGIFQMAGGNALAISDQARAIMQQARQDMPGGVDYTIVFDPTRFVRSSIVAVIHTLLESTLLVVLVVILFLQTWRASIIPLLAMPVSIIGTLSLMLACGFSINALSLFGMVLAIGIVVDDAIVVVENVERNIALGASPKAATYKAMDEVSKPIIAITLTLASVFVPLAFMPGLTGQFYQQFALTIAISTILSAFNSLTLSPALCALLLKPHDAPKDRLSRILDRVLGPLFNGFNRLSARGEHAYGSKLRRVIQRKGMTLGLYAVLLGFTAWLGNALPGGFVPAQDKEFLVGLAQLPSGASLDRTEQVIQRMNDIALKQPGVAHTLEFPGMSVNGLMNSSSAGIIFVILEPFASRQGAQMSATDIAASLNQQFAGIKEAFTGVFPPPPVLGLGTLGGFKLQFEDRGALGFEALNDAVRAFLKEAAQAPELAASFSSYQIDVPQLKVDLDRIKAKQSKVAMTDVFDTLQIYLGSLYVNDFNLLGRVYQVRVQADAPFRAHADDIAQLKTRNADGSMVPLASLVQVKPTYGPEMVVRYNGYTSADLNGGPAPGYSSGQAQAAVERIAAATLPKGIKFEWTELTYQQIISGDSTLWILLICILLVYLVLAALYESLLLPVAILLIVPMGIMSALLGVWLTGGDNNIFTQIGLMVLVGLASKNAILIVEFARELEHQGRSIVQSAIEASQLRLRPILMTSIAFIMGVVPLVLSTGAGAEMRYAMGIAVFFGMLGVTLFGLLLTPVFYVALRLLATRGKRARTPGFPPGIADTPVR